jgi:hypothetical protein
MRSRRGLLNYPTCAFFPWLVVVDGVRFTRAYFQAVAQFKQFGVVLGLDHDGVPGVIVVVEIDQAVTSRLQPVCKCQQACTAAGRAKWRAGWAVEIAQCTLLGKLGGL